MVNCIVVELTDGSLRAYVYPDEESARSWHAECHEEWNKGRNLIFHFPKGSYRGLNEIHSGDEVAHLRLATRESVTAANIDHRDAMIFG